MNNDFPLLSLTQPEIANRRKDPPRRPELPPEILARRQEIASRLIPRVKNLSRQLQQMSDKERKSTLIKVEHDIPISLSGTGLKSVAESMGKLTLAVLRTDNLEQLETKLDEFGSGALKNGHAPNETLAYLKNIQEGNPKDRLCQVFFEQYETLIQQEWIICEIEMMSLQQGKNQQRQELVEIRSSLQKVFANGIYGNIFEHEEIKGTCRAVVRCTGKIFQRLVEDQEWRTKIFWFDARPEFETFLTIYQNFDIQKLGKFISPPEEAPIVCIVDSGVTVGNPFLQPVVRENLLHSFLRSAPDNPYDEHGHGSGVASLASYYALNGYRDAENEGKVWIASARVLDENNQL